MKNWKKVIGVSSIALASVLLLGACGKKSGSSSSDSKGTETIRFSWWGNDDRHKATLAMIDAFEKENPDIKVKAEYSGWDGTVEKMTTQIAGGTEADLMQINYDWYTSYSPDGTGFADLNKYKDELDLSGYSKDALAQGTIDGKLNGVPFGQNAFAIAINKTAWDKLGLEIPTTWDGYVEAAKSFPDGSYPFADQGFNLVYVYLTQKYGKALIDNEGKINYTADQLKEGLDWQKSLVDAKVIPSEKTWIESVGTNNISTVKQFIEGQYAGTSSWSASVQSAASVLSESKQELILPSFPKNDDAKTAGVIKKPSMLFSISKNSKHGKAAAKLLNFMLNEEEGVKANGISRGVPSNEKAIDILNQAGLVTDVDKASADYVENTEGVNESPYYEMQAVAAVYTDTMEQFGLGELDSSKAATQIIDGLKDAIKEIQSQNK